ncbi:hypothetical protein Gotur_018855 [Gossypium turneri]
MANFENERARLIHKKNLKGKNAGLGWNRIKRTIDASDDWWDSRLKMFMWVVATGEAWARFSGTLLSECFKDVDSDMLEENEDENVINDVHISNDVHIDGNNKKNT